MQRSRNEEGNINKKQR
jgi:hypothetical protein